MNESAKVLVKFIGDTKGLDDATKKASNGLSKFKGAAKVAGAAVVSGVATAATVAGKALVDMSKQSLQARADLEQNLGGVETLFKDSADKVIKNANEAYKTAGVSANEYMQGVTSFAASLLQSTAGNTEKAAEISDMAFRDMSDNANKFGTDMAAIQNAYQGFAKQNYTMLDNLKLGYGGTKTEMERLLADAQKLTGVKYDIKNLSDVYSAIHAIQENLGVTGTTAKEATETISGSINMAKKSFENFLAGTASGSDVAKAVVTAAKNIGKELLKIVPDLVEGIVELINGLIPEIPNLIMKLIPVITKGAIELVTNLAPMLPQIINLLLQGLIQIINAIAEALPDLIPAIVEAILEIIPAIIDNLPMFIEAGINLIVGLLSGIIQCAPRLLEYIPKLVISIVKALAKLPVYLWKAGFNAIISLAQAIINNIFRVLEAAKKLGIKVFETIKKILSPGGLAEIGSNLIKGLWNGIKNAKDWVLGKIKGLGESILKGIKSIFGIASPSKEFEWIGQMNMEGFAKGITGMKNKINDAIDTTFQVSPTLSNSANTHFSPNIINNTYVEVKQDPLGQVVNQIKTFQGGAKNDYNYGKA